MQLIRLALVHRYMNYHYSCNYIVILIWEIAVLLSVLFQILLLSLTAGGVGLNLVGANYLMLVDIHWNPQLEAQACDRIYRVGQKKPVYIYRLVFFVMPSNFLHL